MSEAQGEPKFCIMTGMTGNTSIIFQEDKIHFHATQDVKVEGAQKAPLEPLEQPEKQEPEEGITASDIVHAGLAVLSCIPGLGTVAGLIDAGIYAAEGDLTMAGISVLAAVPGAGEAAAIAKLGTKVKTIAKISKVAGVIAKGTKVAKALKVVSKVPKFIIAAAMIKGMYENRAQIKQLLSMMLKGQFNWNDPKFLLGVATLLAQILVLKRFKLKDGSGKASPSEIAKIWQGTEKYPGVDRYRDITLKEGKIVYRGEPNGTEYFTTKSAVNRADGDATKLFEGLQVEKHETFGYRSSVQGYLVKEDASAAFSITKANPDYGKGGLPQIFVPNANELIEKGILVPVDKIKLINYK